ncbi:MAG: flagellar motor switch protein FliG [Desulfofustis sp.]|jgi:flagellar motor switch protein FliG
MNFDNPSGPDKAAIFLMSLGEEAAAHVFKELSDDEIYRITRSMAAIDHIPAPVKNTVLQNYLDDQQKLAGVFVKGLEFARKSISATDSGDRTASLLNQHIADIESKPFSFISTMKPQLVADFLAKEHPQTVALILSTQDADCASAIIICLPEDIQAEIISRMARIEQVPAELILSLEAFLEEELNTTEVEKQKEIDGLGRAVQVLSRMQHDHNKAILEQIDQTDRDLAKTMRSKMFTFERLISLEDDVLQRLVREISNDSLTLALRNSSEALKDRIFSTLSPRAAEMIREDLENLGTIAPQDIEAVQQSILKRAIKLKEENLQRSRNEKSHAVQ